MNIKHPLLLIIILFLLAPLGARASNGWQVTISSSRLAHYLDYPSSSLKSIIKLTVAYQQGDDVSARKLYETLYYNGSLPIGCDKYAPILMTAGAGGVIRVDSDSDDAMQTDECDAVANAAGRLFLDLYLKKYPVYDIVVPASSFDGVVLAFQRSGFYHTDPSNSPRLVLSVVSQPSGRSQSMAF